MHYWERSSPVHNIEWFVFGRTLIRFDLHEPRFIRVS